MDRRLPFTPLAPSRILVCEEGDLLLGRLRPLVEARGFEVQPVARVADVPRLLATAAPSLVVVHLTLPRVDEVLRLLYVLEAHFPHAKSVVVAERDCAAYDWLTRELAAIHFFPSPRDLRPIADVAERFFAASAVPEVKGAADDGLSIDRRKLPWADEEV